MKKLLIWRQTIQNSKNIFSGSIIVEEEEYNLWLKLLTEQKYPFDINISCDVDGEITFENGQELINNVVVSTLDTSTEIILSGLFGHGIGILNFYTDVISSLGYDDIIDMNGYSEEEEEKDIAEDAENKI
jgi:hypothetical protein